MNAFPIGRRALATVLAIAALVAVPAAAAAAPADRGDHGAQARCMYKSVNLPGWGGAMRLNRLSVMPPTLFAVDSAGDVGWRLIVQRRYDPGNWKRIFTSVIQKASATPTTPASFSPLSAHIDSPLFISDGQGGFRSAEYRAVLKFYRFNPNGSIQSLERHVAGNYDVFRAGSYQWTDVHACHHAWIFQ